MNTQCPCPSPPGGAVTCQIGQFAYCYVNAGRVESGCRDIPATQAGRPTVDTIQPLFEEVVESLGFGGVSYQDVSIFTRGDELGPRGGRSQRAGANLAEFLYTCMQEGLVVAIATSRRSGPRGWHFFELLIRFPSIWSGTGEAVAFAKGPLAEL